MARTSGMPDETTLKRWHKLQSEGKMTLTDMVEKWAADPRGRTYSRQAFSMAFSRLGLDAKTTFYYDLIPWKIDADRHGNNKWLRMLRLEAQKREGKRPLTQWQETKLRNAMRELAEPRPNDPTPAPLGCVVQYEMFSPDGVTPDPQGFYCVPRLKSDKDIIRWPRKDQPVRKRPTS